MNHDVLKQAAQYSKEHRKKNRRFKALGAMAAVVVFCTTYALILPAATLERKPVCGLDEHVHDESCYGEVLACALEEFEGEGHVHTDECYTVELVAEEELVCTEAESEGHTHGADCYEIVKTEELTCTEAESEGHTHSSACYETVEHEKEVLTCSDSSEEHEHDESCYTVEIETEEVLVCGEAESEGHTHGADCYEIVETEELTCTEEETEGHTHSAYCYETVENEVQILNCDLDEAVPHTHSEDCYETVLICGLEEHVHDDLCYIEEIRDEDVALDAMPGMALLPSGAQVPEGYTVQYDCADPDGAFAVTVYAPEGALPEEAQLFASLLAENSAEYENAAEALEEDFDYVVALDVHFEVDGVEVEPGDRVYVCINAMGLLPADADPETVSIQHHPENEVAPEVVADSTEETGFVELVESHVEAEAIDVVAAFEVESFSTFTVSANSIMRDSYTWNQAEWDADREVWWDGWNGSLEHANAKIVDVQVADVTLTQVEIIGDTGETVGGSYSVSQGNAKDPTKDVANGLKLGQVYTAANNGTFSNSDGNYKEYSYNGHTWMKGGEDGKKPNGDAKVDYALLEITPEAGYYVTNVVVACANWDVSPLVGCAAWQTNEDHVFQSSFDVTTSSKVSVIIPSDAFCHYSAVATKYYILIATQPLPDPMFVAYDAGAIKDVAAANSEFPNNDSWLRASSDNGVEGRTTINGQNVTGISYKMGTVNIEYQNMADQIAQTTKDEWTKADFTYTVAGITEEALKAAKNAGYEFAGWKLEYYNKATLNNGKTVVTISEFNGDSGSSVVKPFEQIEVNGYARLVAQWVPIPEPVGYDLTLNKVAGNLNADGTKIDIKDEETPLAALPGATFQLYEGDGTDVIATLSPTKASGVDGDATAATENQQLKFDTVYRLEETEAPAGYNLLSDPIYFTATTDGLKLCDVDGQTLSYTNAKVQTDAETLTLIVANYGGFVLPSTGGPGTDWMYALGGALLITAAAAAVLVYKKRDGKEDCA